MSPMVWVVLLLIALVFEFIRADLFGACGAIGAISGLLANVFSVHPVIQILIVLGVCAALVYFARPVGMKYVNRIKKHNKMIDLEGSDAIVICRIDNAQGVGVVNINGHEWAARSNRPNAIFNEGEVVTVRAMRDGKAYVDYKRR